MKKFGKIIAMASALLFATSMYFSCSNNADEPKKEDQTGGDNNNKVETSENTNSFNGEEQLVLEASKISENTASITITVTNVTGTTSGDWWFWAKTDDSDGDKIVWKSGEASIYELTITDAAKIAYIKENGLAIKGATGLTAKVSVTTTTKTDVSNGNGDDSDDDTGGDDSGENNKGDDDSGTSDPVSSTGAITESGIDFAKLGIKVKASTATFPQDFVRGFDTSTVYAIENAGMKYLDADGKENDIFKVLKASGVNMIRLRIWNDPSKDDEASKQGRNNLEVTKALAKRATAAGMQYMLDFHFSDTWADPLNQKCPDSWKGITTADEMEAAIANFVESTLQTLKESTALPAMVQLGNECEGGILLSNTANTTVQAKAGSENFKAYINAAAEKVRAADETIKIVMHTSRGGNASVVKNFIANTNGIDFDYIGLSYYPFFTSHGTLENLKANIKEIKNKGKKAIISETSFCWTCDWDSRINDGVDNQLWYYDKDNNGLVQAAKSLIDSSGKLVMGLNTMTEGGKTVIAPTVQNQYNAVAAVMEASAEAGADGVIYWGGDWITNSAGSVPSAMENQAFWDYDHKILDSAAVFSYGTQKSNTAASSGGESTSGGGTLVKDASLSSITTTLPGVTVLEGTKFSALSESNTITVTININSWLDGSDTWYCYTIDGSTYKANIDTWGDKSVSTTITGADITTLKLGSLTIYGNNKNATVTVSYE